MLPRTVALLAAALALLLGVAAPALAADPAAPSGSAHYAGSGELTSSTSGTFTAQGAIDCTGSPCVLTMTFTNGSQTGDLFAPLPLAQGANASYPLAESGDPCTFVGGTSDYRPGGSLTLRTTATQLGFTLVEVGPRSFDCTGDGSTDVTYDGGTLTGALPVVSGSGCAVLGTCPGATPDPAASAAVTGPRAITPATTFASPGVLSTLPTAQAAVTPRNALWAVAAAVVLVILIALPSALLNSATERWGERLGAWWRRVRPWGRRPAAAGQEGGEATAAPARAVRLAGWPLAAVGVLAASVISAFVDPAFGLNGASVRVFLSILTSFVLDAVVGWFALILLVRRTHPSATASFTFAPASLLVVAVAVLFTRLTGFQPGIVFGLVAGVAFGAVLATADKARVALIGLAYSFGVGVIAWIGYSVVAAAVPHPGAGLVFVQETLSSMAIGGIAALPIALVPLRGLTGYEIFTWNRAAWGGAYLAGLVGFFLVLMPMPFSWQTVPLSLWTWIAIFAAFAVAGVVLWLLAARPWRRPEATA